jgi:hypothetical protein
VASIEGPQPSRASLPPLPPVGTPAAPANDRFLEPISSQWIARGGSQPIAEWISSLPRTDIGLSTLEHWLAGSPEQATATEVEAQVRALISPQASDSIGRTTLIDNVRREFDDIKVGYAMGQVAAGIEARIAASPGVPSSGSAALATELRNRGAALSLGAAREATTLPNSYNFAGTCYTNADAMARAVMQEKINPSGTVVREYTPAMQQRDQQAALDRAVLGQPSPLGLSWGQTAYMYARGNGASLDAQQRAYALGTGGDALLGIGGAVAGLAAARTGQALPGGQAAPVTTSRSPTPPTAPPATPAGAYPVYLARASTQSAALGQVQGTYTGLVSSGMQGPLPSNLAGTFAGGRYDVVRLTHDTVLYRAGVAGKPLGQFFSRTEPQGVLQTRIDQAVLPRWPDGGTSPLDTAYAIKIPAGTEVYVGRIGTQGGAFAGGTDQILVRQPWTIDGVQVVGARPIR